MDLSWCPECSALRDWGPSVILAIFIAVGVVLGLTLQWIANRRRMRTAVTLLTCVVCIVLATRIWFSTRSLYLPLPFLGVMAGVLRRRNENVTIFGSRNP